LATVKPTRFDVYPFDNFHPEMAIAISCVVAAIDVVPCWYRHLIDRLRRLSVGRAHRAAQRAANRR
jgi:hypothetical protein